MSQPPKDSKLPKPQKLHGIFGILGAVQPAKVVKAPVSSIKTDDTSGYEWVDIENPNNENLFDTAKKYKLHDVHVQQAQTKGQISQLVIEKEYLFLILHFPHIVPNEQRIASSQVTIFLGKKFLVTIHDDKTPTIRECFYNHAKDHQTEQSHSKAVFHII